jgi:hypothetical protein
MDAYLNLQMTAHDSRVKSNLSIHEQLNVWLHNQLVGWEDATALISSCTKFRTGSQGQQNWRMMHTEIAMCINSSKSGGDTQSQGMLTGWFLLVPGLIKLL